MYAQSQMLNAVKPVVSWSPMNEAFARFESTQEKAELSELDRIVTDLAWSGRKALERAESALAL
jgi:hypothetical protein